ncbi:tyrosine-type recombinase/integrase [Microlunatus antarcticus]|uniref:Integrase n=1 Tax=Microlunatus antarcticus TaxID=53388 RepID=A0A7W5P6F9_9ACTN|nr:site-specific integrase [Microlunatus antarcticus]MBB3326332.1 integrase [Microlunatus antarcticus]
MAYIERRVSRRRDAGGRMRENVRYKVRYRDSAGTAHSETVLRRTDAERRKAEIEVGLGRGTWQDPKRGEVLLKQWVAEWLPTRHDLRATTKARLELTMAKQVLPRFGSAKIGGITNGEIRGWVSDLLTAGLLAASTRKAVFALRQTLEAAIADGRILHNPADKVPLPSERQKRARYLSQQEVERLVSELRDRDRALVLVGAYGGLRWGEAAGLRRRDIDPLRSRIRVEGTAVQLGGTITLDNEPKTARSKRSVPLARSVMRRIEHHLDEYVDADPNSLVFTAPGGGPLFRAWSQNTLAPAARRAHLEGITFHGLRHSFVAIMVAAGCNVREVSEWAGHNSVAFTLTRYGGLFEDGTDAAVDRLDALLAPS